MNHRVRAITAAALAVILIGCSGEPVTRPPDVVLITIDALRADALSYAGYPLQTSPVLDGFAAESVVFEAAIASFSSTTPSMASLMTGLWPSFEGITQWRPATWYGFSDLAAPDERGTGGLTSGVRTLAEVLSANGYHTAGFNTNQYLRRRYNFNQGFREYHQFEPYLKQMLRKRMTREGTHRMQGHYPPARRVIRKVCSWLDGDRPSAPTFLWIHLMEPHSPYLPPEPLNRRFGASYTELSDPELNEVLYHLIFTLKGSGEAAKYPSLEQSGLARDEFIEHLRGLYDGEIRFLDRVLERLRDSLEAHDMWHEAVVMIAADHGEEFFDHDGVTHHHRSAMAEELIRVPLLIKPPSGWGFQPGRRIPDVVRMVDFAPTLLDYAGLRAEAAHMDGSSLRPLIEGTESGDRTAFISAIWWGIVRDGQWKYRFEKSTWTGGEPRERLFLITEDPLERSDVADQHPHELGRLRRLFGAFAEDLRSRGSAAVEPFEMRDSLDDEQIERLKALGYIEE